LFFCTQGTEEASFYVEAFCERPIQFLVRIFNMERERELTRFASLVCTAQKQLHFTPQETDHALDYSDFNYSAFDTIDWSCGRNQSWSTSVLLTRRPRFPVSSRRTVQTMFHRHTLLRRRLSWYVNRQTASISCTLNSHTDSEDSAVMAQAIIKFTSDHMMVRLTKKTMASVFPKSHARTVTLPK
jgi:hypothetical protein